jgi:arsenate reductase-like glutaredoxin family protein
MAKKIDWSYHRVGCTTCGKTQAFLGKHGIETKEQVDARKVRLGPEEALEIARQASQIYATKGKKVIHVNLKKDAPDDETLTSLLIGPSGNLRAPTFRIGKTLMVGFDEATYETLFA